MSHSNSSLNCFANCMAKYEHSYILHTPPCKPISPHLTFGVMAHDVLYKAGTLRDNVKDNVISKEEYIQTIPSEVLYTDLKQEFGIKSWNNYFIPVIKKVVEYENKLVEELLKLHDGPVHINREVKLQLTTDQIKSLGYYSIQQPLVGVVDLLIRTNTHAVIIDYKFSSSKKSQDDFDMNSQLPLYALFIHKLYNIPLRNIQYGYIDIPKQEFGVPTILSNGTLSRAKSQNVSQEFYEQAVSAIHGDDPYYNCKEGGYYYDCWCNLALNQPAYLSIQYLDEETYNGIITDLLDAAQMIDYMIEHKMIFLKKYDSFSCKSCEFVKYCKKWLNIFQEE